MENKLKFKVAKYERDGDGNWNKEGYIDNTAMGQHGELFWIYGTTDNWGKCILNMNFNSKTCDACYQIEEVINKQ